MKTYRWQTCYFLQGKWNINSFLVAVGCGLTFQTQYTLSPLLHIVLATWSFLFWAEAGGACSSYSPSPFLIPAAKFRELKCSALRSLLAPPQSTSGVNFPPGTRDDAFLDYISRGRSGAVRAQSLTQKENRPPIQPLRSSTLGTNCQPLVSESASFSSETSKRNSFNY